MESLRWRRLGDPGSPGTERVRPVVRRRSAAVRSRDRVRLGVLALGAAVALGAGLVVSIGHAPGAGSRAASTPGDGTRSLAALAPDVAGRPWLVHRGDDDRWVWGHAGDRARNLLPSGESGLAISDRWLASGISTPAMTRIRIRDLRTGAVAVDQELDFRAAAAAFAGDRLLVTGYLGGIAGADGGLVAIGASDGALRTLIAGGPFPARLGVHPSKGDVHLSGDGTLAAVNTCGSLACDTIVIDTATLAVSTPQQGGAGFLRAVTGDVLVLTDADGAWIKGIGARNGRPRFTLAGASLMAPASMADGRVIGNVGRGEKGWQVAAFGVDGRLAPVTDLARSPGPWVWPSVSSPTVAVLGGVPFEAALASDIDAPSTLVRGADLRELGTVVVQPAASGAQP
jgi:hypothetical protein